MKRLTTRQHATLKQWRARYRLSTYQAAELLGISQSTYYRVEVGAQRLRGPIAKQVHEVTGVPIDALVGAK